MPSFTSYLALAALTSFASAITINEPSKNTIWDSSKSNKISWTFVNTDPTSFDIYLAHMSGQPALYSLLFENVDVTKLSESVANLQLPTGIAYQINFVAHDKPEQIYAQSQQFNVTGDAVDNATSTVDGYTGPTYSPSAADSSKTTMETSTTATGGAAAETSGSKDSTSGSASTTPSSSGSSSASNATITNGSDNSASGASSSPSPTTSPNAAVVNGAATGLIGMVFGAVALLM